MSSTKATLRAFEDKPMLDLASSLATGFPAGDARYPSGGVGPSLWEIAR